MTGDRMTVDRKRVEHHIDLVMGGKEGGTVLRSAKLEAIGADAPGIKCLLDSLCCWQILQPLRHHQQFGTADLTKNVRPALDDGRIDLGELVEAAECDESIRFSRQRINRRDILARPIAGERSWQPQKLL